MKVRIISAAVGIVVLAGVLLIPNPIALVIACAAAAALAVYELLNNTGLMKQKSLLGISMGFAAAEVLVCYYVNWFSALVPASYAVLALIVQYLPVILLVAYVLCLVVHIVIPAVHITLESGEYAFLLTLYATAGFGCIALLRAFRNVGLWLVLLLMVIAWMSDTGAYFVGTFLGKHKMAPKLSPKKSWEGFFGGWLISVAAAVGLFFLRLHWFSGENLFGALILYILVALVLAPLSVVGDLLASFIKRKTGIKDYGKIMPGHGGVMDRFDSVMFIAPMLYLVAVNYSVINNAFIDLIRWIGL